MKKLTTMVIAFGCLALITTSCKEKKTENPEVISASELQQKVDEYAFFDLTTDISKLSEKL